MTTLELRPPDLENLADRKIPCPNYDKHGDVPELAAACELCEGKGEVIEPTGRERMSHTSLSMQLACLRKYGWAYVERLELIAKPRPLSMGSAFHQAIELGDPAAGSVLLDREPVDQDDADRIKIDRAIVEAAAALYMKTYRPTESRGEYLGFPVVGDTAMGAGEVATMREVEYLVRLRNPATGAYSRTFDLYGFADGVIDHGDYLELIEDKFVGRVDSLTVKKVKLDRQVSLECYALWRATGKPVRVVRYRYTKKPSIKVKQKETVDEFVQRLHEDYAARPDFYTHEETTTRSADDLLLVEAELWDWAEQRRDAGHRNFYARNTSHCSDYGGCAFIDLCVGDPDARALYQQRPERLIQLEDRS